MIKKEPLVSVIIPMYNEEKNISACLKSLQDQSYKNLEIITIDDGSTDTTAEIVKEFPVKLLYQNHGGPGRARNLAVRDAKGKILVFADSDMTFDKNFVEELVRPIIEGKYRGTFSKEELVRNWDNVWSRCWNYNQNWPEKRMIPADYPDEGKDFRAILKEDFLRVGGFDDTGYTDTWTLSEKLGYKPHSVSGAKYYHVNPDNLGEVYRQARWSAKRAYKLGLLGVLIALTRMLPPVSLVVGLFKSVRFREPMFLPFKLVYDLGTFSGVSEKIFRGNLSK